MRRIAPWLFLIALAGCGDTGITDATPPPPPPAPNDTFAVFNDPASDFQTVDVRDSENDVVRFDTSDDTLVWVASGEKFEGWVVAENFLDDPVRSFVVRFGTVNDERRAYFTETGRGTICEIAIVGGELQVSQTDLLPPQ